MTSQDESPSPIDDGMPPELLRVAAALESGDVKTAEAELRVAMEALGEDDIDVVEMRGDLALAKWEIDEAHGFFEAVRDTDEDAYILSRCAVLADLDGDAEKAIALLTRAHELDPASHAPIHVTEAAFDSIVEEALAEMPDVFKKALDKVRVVREPMPFVDLVNPSAPHETPPDVLGLFVGPSIHELAEEAPGELPPTIYLFQRNLERLSPTEEDLRIEIRVTLFHEIGHLLGLDEDEVAAMGLA